MLLGVPHLSGAAPAPATNVQAAANAAFDAALNAPEQGGGPFAAGGPVDTALKSLVDKGTITQAQADAVKTALQDQFKNMKPRGPGGPLVSGIKPANLDLAASTIGISRDDLITQLRDGKSIADVAKSKNVDPAKVIQALVDDANKKIDQAKTDGKITDAQATNLKGQLQQRITDMVNNAHPGAGFRPGFGHRRGGPDGDNGGAQPAQPGGTQ